MNAQLELAFSKVENALVALEVMVKKPMEADRGNVDACIQRFEFTIELSWKLLRRILEEEGIVVDFPKQVLREAYQKKLINDQHIWLAMLKDRNNTSHTYNIDLADEIYGNITQHYFSVLNKTYEDLAKRYQF